MKNDPQIRPASEARLQIGDLARLSGKSVRALYLYEEKGLLTPGGRSSGGFRLYDYDALTRVRWIERMQALGFSLPQIGEILADLTAAETPQAAMDILEAIYRNKLEEISQRIEKLNKLGKEVEESLEYLKGCNSCSADDILTACSGCRRDERKQKQPTLVAGPSANG